MPNPKSDSKSPLNISLDLALSGKGAPPKGAYDASLAKAGEALDWLREQYKSKSLELLQIPSRTADLRQAEALAKTIGKGMKTVAVLGIGGSSLGGQALTVLSKKSTKRAFVEFHDNPDPLSWRGVLKRVDKGLDITKTHFICISKSGGTAETLSQVLSAEAALKKAGVKNIKKHFTIITEPHKSPLRDFAESIGAPTLDHPTGVGGRYSVLTVVGLLPALMMQLDARALRRGAQAVLEQTLTAKSPQDAPVARGAALHHALAEDGRLATTILWPYADKLAIFGGWWRQLWAESLGKDGKGSTPVSVLGPVDQHSQLQLFRDGPGNALFTIMTVDTKGQGASVPGVRAKQIGVPYLAGKTLGDLVDAEARATAQTLFKNGRPVRVIHMPKVDEFDVGALMMHFMLETIVMGKLMGVDPFDQPGVEEAKVLTRQYLAEK
jgi:glucose-6-phosphate isomerase